MFVEVSHIPTIVAEFVTTVVMPKAPTGLMKFGIGFVSPYISPGVRSFFTSSIRATSRGPLSSSWIVIVPAASVCLA